MSDFGLPSPLPDVLYVWPLRWHPLLSTGTGEGYSQKAEVDIQGSAKRCSPGCVNAAGKARQKW